MKLPYRATWRPATPRSAMLPPPDPPGRAVRRTVRATDELVQGNHASRMRTIRRAVSSPDQLSLREARWLAIEAQGLAEPRPAGRIGTRHLRSLVGRVGTIQLDAVNVV